MSCLNQDYVPRRVLLSVYNSLLTWLMVFVVGETVLWHFKNGPYVSFTSVSLRNTPYRSFSNQIAFPCLAYFSEIVAIYCMISTDRQHQLIYSINSLKQVRFITTEQDLSLATYFMLSSLEPIKCMPFSRESVPRFGTLFLIWLKYLNVRPFVKK